MPGIPSEEARELREAVRAARATSLRFGEMLARHLQRRQWVQGLSFGLSSAAALAVLVGPWPQVASVLAGTVAVANASGTAACPHQELVRLAALRSGWVRFAGCGTDRKA